MRRDPSILKLEAEWKTEFVWTLQKRKSALTKIEIFAVKTPALSCLFNMLQYLLE
jgi:hypothetical protein